MVGRRGGKGAGRRSRLLSWGFDVTMRFVTFMGFRGDGGMVTFSFFGLAMGSRRAGNAMSLRCYWGKGPTTGVVAHIGRQGEAGWGTRGITAAMDYLIPFYSFSRSKWPIPRGRLAGEPTVGDERGVWTRSLFLSASLMYVLL
jgi:hypothetical protein